jgi:hypothetical protein
MRLGIRATTFITVKSVLLLLSVPNGSQVSHAISAGLLPLKLRLGLRVWVYFFVFTRR